MPCVHPATANVMLVFGNVRQMQEVTEGADDRYHRVARQAVEDGLQFGARRRTQIAVTTLVQPDRSLANTLDGAKHVVTFLFPHGIAQQAAEQAGVVTKREIFVFGRHGQRAQEGWSENYLLKASANERSSRGRMSIRGKWPLPRSGRYPDETRLRPAALAL